MQLIITIEEAMKRAGTREELLREMNQRDYHVRWEGGRKCITYTTPSGMKCRDDKLHELNFRKERMEHEFRIRTQTAKKQLAHPQTTNGSNITHAPHIQATANAAGEAAGVAGTRTRAVT